MLNPFSVGNFRGSTALFLSALFLDFVNDGFGAFLCEAGIEAELEGRFEVCAESAEGASELASERALSDRVASCMGVEWISRGSV